MFIGVFAFSGIYPSQFGGPQEFIYHFLHQSTLQSTNTDFMLCYREYSTTSTDPIPLPPEKVSVESYRVPRGSEIRLPIAALRASIRLRHTDIVYFNSPPFSLEPLIIHRKKRPLAYDFHGGLFAEELFRDRFFKKSAGALVRWMFRRSAGYFDCVIAHSQYMADIAEGAGIPNSKINILPLGIDLTQFQEAEETSLTGDPSILFVGRLEPVKGCHVLLDALASIYREFPDLHLHIVGQGSQHGQLTSQIKELKLEANVTFYTLLPRERLVSMYKSVDISVFPSTYNEGFGMAVVEAMAGEGTVIASATGGMKDRIENGVDGLLTEPGNVENLTDCLRQVIADTTLRSRLKERAKAKALNHDWPLIIPSYLQLLNNIERR